MSTPTGPRRSRRRSGLRIGRFLQGLLVLLWAIYKLNINWTIAKVLLLIGSILGGNFLFSGLIVLQATLSIWTVESLEIVNSFTYGGVEAAQYPISIYKTWFRNVLIYIIPLATVNYFPSMALLEKTEINNSWIGWISPFFGFIFFIASLWVWKIGVRHYTSTGS